MFSTSDQGEERMGRLHKVLGRGGPLVYLVQGGKRTLVLRLISGFKS